MKRKKAITSQLILIIGVVILVNILSEQFFTRVDLTEDQRYSLSNATENILNDLEEPVTITAYFTEDLPPQYAKVRRQFKDLLIEYDNRSRGMVVYEFINPNKEEDAEMKARQAGIQPVLINVREKDQMKQQRAYMGAVVQKGDDKEIIPFIQEGTSMEYNLSTSIKKLSVKNKPKVGLLQGHGEAPLSDMQQVNQELSVLYDVEEVTMNDTAQPDFTKYKAVAIIAPTDTFPQSHLQMLDNYLAQGGRLMLAVNRVSGDFQTQQGQSQYTGLTDWLSQKGITIENNFVIDANAAAIGVRQNMGGMNVTRRVQFPYIPIINNFEEHAITKGLEQVLFQFTSSISFTGDTSLTYKPLVKSSENSGTKTPPFRFNVQKQWTKADFPLSHLTVGAILKGNLVGNAQSSMVVFSDGDFPVGGQGREARQVNKDNVSLLVNSIDWLADDTGLIELRTKGVTARPLEQVEDNTKLILKVTNFLLPIILIIAYGIIRSVRNRNRRVKRMEVGHV
ncbi:MAG: GldG family protein [Bacteroidales bacterium]|nr:GldG family protein [Bacteroidales bacterium]